MTEIEKALRFLRDAYPMPFTPDAIREKAGLTISGATLGRKLRERAAKGEIAKSYYTSPRGEEIAQYSAIVVSVGQPKLDLWGW